MKPAFGKKRRHPALLFLRSIRIPHWSKNLLVFIPAIMAHRIMEPAVGLNAATAFLALGLCASGVYLLNDILDFKSDRAHPKKKYRPLASGELSVGTASRSALLLIALGGAAASPLPRSFTAILAAYLAAAAAYVFIFRKIVLLDVFLLAGLYTLRVFAGAVAVDVPVSNWLLAFTTFFFLSLAFAKRYAELIVLRRFIREPLRERGYRNGDAAQLGVMGITSGYLSVLVLALYITSKEVTVLYSRPDFLWFLCPLILYWASRVWFMAHRGRIREDPVVFAIKDKMSYLVGALAALFLFLAI